MFRSYIIIALRTLRKNRVHALINVVGLALGLGCALLLFALVRYHYQTDRYQTHFDRIYRITSTFRRSDGQAYTPGVPMAFGKTIRTDYPDIERVVMTDEMEDPVVSVPTGKQGEAKYKETGAVGAFVEPAFFRLFDYSWLAGGPDDLAQPGTVVLSAKLARKYFGTEQALGKMLKLDTRYPLRVVGIFADYRHPTDLAYQLMPGWASWEGARGEKMPEGFSSTGSATRCYVLLNDRFTAANWSQQMPAFLKKHLVNNDPADVRTYPIQPLADMHFSTEYGGVSRGMLASLLAIGLLLIGTACINFINLATAQALNRSREVGVRKALGSTRGQLVGQFMGETGVIVIGATAGAGGIFWLGIQEVPRYLHGPFQFRVAFEPLLLVYLVALVVGVTLLAGFYPALVLARLAPVNALTGQISLRQVGGLSLRRGLVVAQVAISQMLIIGLLVVAYQLYYLRHKDLGFRQEAILTVPFPFLADQDVVRLNTFKQQVLALPEVQQLSFSSDGAPQGGNVNETDVRYDTRPKEDVQTQQTYFDAAYVDLYGLKLVAGRNLYPSDTTREALVNEQFVRTLGLNNPQAVLGKYIHSRGNRYQYEIVGVLKDYHQRNLHQAVYPLFASTKAIRYYYASLQVRSRNYPRLIGQLGALYNRLYPDSYFEPRFVDALIEQQYQAEQTLGVLFNFFAGVALLIGCLGLYGLVLFMVGQKTKEIGVRKVLGASLGSVLWLFGREFTLLILLAFVVAAPLTWWVMSRWLQGFSYRIDLSPGLFALGLLATVLVALLTVGYQSLKAARLNPAKTLRTE